MNHLLTERDIAFYNWLSYYKSKDEHFTAHFNNGVLVCHSSQGRLAESVWESHPELLPAIGADHIHIQLTNYGKTYLYMSTLDVQKYRQCRSTTTTAMNNLLDKMPLSKWAQDNLSIYRSFAEEGTTVIYSATSDLLYVDIQPLYGLEEVMCQPVKELIGKPSRSPIVPSEIAEAKSRCAEAAIRNGGVARDSYTFDWNGLFWTFKIESTYLAGHDQVMSRTFAGDPAQNYYWQMRREHLRRYPPRIAGE